MAGWRSGAACPGFGAELKRRRLAASLTQAVLAERVGMDRTLVARLEKGERRPSLPTAVKLAAALGGSEKDRCRLVLAAGFLPPGYEVTGLRRKKRVTA